MQPEAITIILTLAFLFTLCTLGYINFMEEIAFSRRAAVAELLYEERPYMRPQCLVPVPKSHPRYSPRQVANIIHDVMNDLRLQPWLS